MKEMYTEMIVVDNTIPEFVKWEDDVIIERLKNEKIDPTIVLKMEKDKTLFNINNYELIRKIVTILPSFNFEWKYPDDIELQIKVKNKVRNLLNLYFNFLLTYNGNSIIAEYYNEFDKIFNKEKYLGEVRYNLLNMTINKGHTEMSILKQTCWYIHLAKYKDNITNISILREIFNYLLYWEFGNQTMMDKHIHSKNNEYDFRSSKKVFNLWNEERKKEIKDQDKFVYYMTHNNYDKAYEMIEDQIIDIISK